MRPLLATVAALVAVLWVRRDLAVRAIRALDRGGGLASSRGQRAYARSAGLFRPLHRLAAAEAALRVGPGDTVVDVGAGPGDLLIEVRRRVPEATLVGVEPSATMRSLAAGRGVRVLDGRAEALPLPDASADLVISTLSAHHWDDPVAAFAEIARVLRPGGEACIYDVRFAGYGRREAESIAAAAGLDPARVRHDVVPARLWGLRPYARITIHP